MTLKKTLPAICIIVPAMFFAACGGGGGGTGQVAASAQTPALVVAPPPVTPVSTDLPVPIAPAAGNNFHPDFKGWGLVWSDEFNGAALDRSKWEVETSCWGGGNNERQCYTDRPRNVEVVNGLLRLKAYPESFTGPRYPQGFPGGDGGQVTQNYTSGKVRTRELADWTYGRFEARMKLPTGQATWPAFWMLPADNAYGDWPLSGEIDIVEAVNLGANCTDCGGSTAENRASGALHFGNAWPDNTLITDKVTLPGDAAALDSYHVFAVEWGEGRMNWFVDGIKYMTVTQDRWFTAARTKDQNANAPFDKTFYLMFNLAVGGNFPEGANENTFEAASFPSELTVDWVRVYQCDNDINTGRVCMDGE